MHLIQLCEHGVIPDYLKIYAALVKGFDQRLRTRENKNHDHFSILGIRNITSLAKDLGRSFSKEIAFVAGFVSNEPLRKALAQEGVNHFQGFFLAQKGSR